MHSTNTEAIARELDRVQQMPIDGLMTGWFAQMDQHVSYLTYAYPQLREAHAAFAQTRQYIWEDELTPETWQQVQVAAAKLASALRELGNLDIPLCGQQTSYGVCKYGLPPDGICPRQEGHTIQPI